MTEDEREAKRKLYQEYRDRWRRVNAFQQEELRRLSPAKRLKQFFELVALAKADGLAHVDRRQGQGGASPMDFHSERPPWLRDDPHYPFFR